MNLTLLPGEGCRYIGEKTPSETPRVPIPASPWLTTGDSVTNCQLIDSPNGILVTITEEATPTPKITISGGNHGQRYKLPLLISTNYGLKIQVTIFIDIKNHARGFV